METKQHATEQLLVNEEIKREIKKRQMKIRHKSVGCSKSSSKTEVYSSIGLLQETRRISHNLTLQLKELEEKNK